MNVDEEKSTYKFHEEIIKMIRPLIHEGFTGIILTSEERKPYSKKFLDHVSKHHKWLGERVPIKLLIGKATTAGEVIQLIKANRLQETVTDAAIETSAKLLEQLEKAIDEGNILYTIEELNYAINSNRKPIKIMITEEFNQRNRTSRKFQSVIQISKNLGAIFIVLKTTNPVYPRIKQIGGFACIITH